MIKYVTGNLLEADVEALVNSVNTVGVMGKGVALQFRQAFPENYDAYRRACSLKQLEPGKMFVFRTGQLTNPRYIINFPTKRHWKGKSRMADIESGLPDLVRVVRELGIRSLALPPLGCGSGGLEWSEVRPRIDAALAHLKSVSVLVYEPLGAPAPERMRVATKRPTMTRGRAALLGVLKTYALPGYRLSMLEIQKLAYFLQEAGEPLKLQFVKGQYGPYSDALHHVLQRIEGHFIRGYGDRSRGASVRVMTEAASEAADHLEQHADTRERLERVKKLIEGFETPYALELLSSVHWLAKPDRSARIDSGEAVRGIQAWSAHKKQLFEPRHIETAWSHLRKQGWLEDSAAALAEL